MGLWLGQRLKTSFRILGKIIRRHRGVSSIFAPSSNTYFTYLRTPPPRQLKMLAVHLICLCTARHDVGQVRRQLIESVVLYLNAARQVVADSCLLVSVFVCVLVLVDLLSAVVWIYLRRLVSITHCSRVCLNGAAAAVTTAGRERNEGTPAF